MVHESWYDFYHGAMRGYGYEHNDLAFDTPWYIKGAIEHCEKKKESPVEKKKELQTKIDWGWIMEGL